MAVAPARTVRAAAGGDARIAAALGWAPLLLQATRYTSARSLNGHQAAVAYGEVSATAIGRTTAGWGLVPLPLLVDLPLARDLGGPYGFRKTVVPALRVEAGSWSVRALAGEGRMLVAARGPGAALLAPVRWALGRARLRVSLPWAGVATRFRFERVGRVAPAVGTASPALRAWACGAVAMLPLGAAVQGFQFVLEEPRALATTPSPAGRGLG